MENDKNLNENPAFQELPDESLNAVAGGNGFIEANTTIRELDTTTPVAVQWDSLGRAIQWKKGNETYHYECPVCHRKMHFGSFGALYCDPCNDYFYWSPNSYRKLD